MFCFPATNETTSIGPFTFLVPFFGYLNYPLVAVFFRLFRQIVGKRLPKLRYSSRRPIHPSKDGPSAATSLALLSRVWGGGAKANISRQLSGRQLQHKKNQGKWYVIDGATSKISEGRFLCSTYSQVPADVFLFSVLVPPAIILISI